MALAERVKPKKKEAKIIVEYHPRGNLDKALRWLKNKTFHGWRTQVIFETDVHEHPVGGKVYGTDIRNETRHGG